MKTDIIMVTNSGSRMEQALSQVDKVAAYKGMPHKDALRLRLLAEEMMGMMRSITGTATGLFWMEDADQVYELHLQVQTRMTNEKRENLLQVSSSGKNDSAQGLMGRLRDFFDRGADEDVVAANPLVLSGMYDDSTSPALDFEWRMTEYQRVLSEKVDRDDGGAREAWDELEKSVVAHAADEVKVAIRGRTVEMVLIKKLAWDGTEQDSAAALA